VLLPLVIIIIVCWCRSHHSSSAAVIAHRLPQPSSTVHRPSLIVRRSSSVAHRSSSVAHRSSSVAHRSSSVAHHSSSVARRPSLIVRCPSLVVHRLPLLIVVVCASALPFPYATCLIISADKLAPPMTRVRFADPLTYSRQPLVKEAILREVRTYIKANYGKKAYGVIR
jgi:hypothetical protein